MEHGEGRSTVAPPQPSPTPLPLLFPGVDLVAGTGCSAADLAPSTRGGSAGILFVLLAAAGLRAVPWLPGTVGRGRISCCRGAGLLPVSALIFILPPTLSPPCGFAELALVALGRAEYPMPVPRGEGGSVQDI